MKYKCPCCDYYTFPVPEKDSWGFICPVCFWESDLFINSKDKPSGCNHGLTLNEARKNYQSFGACEKGMVEHVRKPTIDEMKNDE